MFFENVEIRNSLEFIFSLFSKKLKFSLNNFLFIGCQTCSQLVNNESAMFISRKHARVEKLHSLCGMRK